MNIDPNLVEYTVEGSTFDYWEKWHTGMTWEQINPGHWEQIGTGHGVDGKKLPVCVQVFYARLNGRLVAFYEGTSQLVDWVAVEAWVKAKFPNAKGNCDSLNFSHCLQALDIKVELTRCKPCDSYSVKPR